MRAPRAIFIVCPIVLAVTGCAHDRTVWRELAPIPDACGLAGALVGISHGALIVAGGTNFAPPVWDTSKAWHDRIYVLPSPHGEWIEAGRLPRPIGYTMTASYRENGSGRELVACLGGEDGVNLFRDAFAMEYDASRGRVVIHCFPELPTPLANGSAAIVGRMLYVVGGQTGADVSTAIAHGFRLNLDVPEAGWEQIPSIPGGPRVFTHLVTQRTGGRSHLYVIGGRRAGSEAAGLEFLRDTWVFDPATDRWTSRAAPPSEVTAGEAVAVDDRHVLLLGYANADALREAEARGIAIRDFAHPGFPRDILAYDTGKDEWRTLGTMPANQVTTTALPWAGGIVIPSGEIRPRVRSPRVWHVTVKEKP